MPPPRETPACPVITYVSILTLFSVILLTNVHHHQVQCSLVYLILLIFA